MGVLLFVLLYMLTGCGSVQYQETMHKIRADKTIVEANKVVVKKNGAVVSGSIVYEYGPKSIVHKEYWSKLDACIKKSDWSKILDYLENIGTLLTKEFSQRETGCRYRFTPTEMYTKGTCEHIKYNLTMSKWQRGNRVFRIIVPKQHIIRELPDGRWKLSKTDNGC